MKLYHATPEANLASIMKKGLLPAMDGVYMTDDIRAAQWFARHQEAAGSVTITPDGNILHKPNPHSVILEIEYDDLDTEKLGRNHEMLCEILKTTDFYYYFDTVKPKSIKPIKFAEV